MLLVEQENLAFVAKNLGNYEEATEIWRNVLERCRKQEDWAEAAFRVIGMGVVAAATGAPERAATLLAAGDAAYKRHREVGLLRSDEPVDHDRIGSCSRAGSRSSWSSGT